MTAWPVHARIDGPIVMIGFGSIGRGTLPLIERHFEYDKSRFTVIDPVDTHKDLADKHGLRFEQVEPPAKWCADLQLFAVSDVETGEPLGLFYLDMFPREGKYNHFAQFGIIEGSGNQQNTVGADRPRLGHHGRMFCAPDG